MEAHAIASLPLETRNYNQLALLMPGAVTTSPGSFNTGLTTFNSGRPYINGNREQANYYLLDGMDNNEFVDNNVAYSPNVDAIQEFNVITNNPGAEFGHFLGGVISASTESGTNQFHGNAFEFLRNDFFNANEWSRNFSPDPTVNSAPPKQRWNEFGGTLGGPIKKDKLFFFADYQGSRFDTPATPAPITTFTAQERDRKSSPISRDRAALSRHHRAHAGQSDAGGDLRGGPDDGIVALHQRHQPHCFEDSWRLPQPIFPAPTTVRRTMRQHPADLYSRRSGRRQGGLDASDHDHFFARYSQQYIKQPTINSQPLLYNSNGNNIFPLQSGVLDYTRTFSADPRQRIPGRRQLLSRRRQRAERGHRTKARA